jgi:hypothetical protein
VALLVRYFECVALANHHVPRGPKLLIQQLLQRFCRRLPSHCALTDDTYLVVAARELFNGSDDRVDNLRPHLVRHVGKLRRELPPC